MTVHLSPELEQLVQDLLNSGRYKSAEEVVCDAVWLLAARDHLADRRKQQLRQKIAIARESLQRGEPLDGDSLFNEPE